MSPLLASEITMQCQKALEKSLIPFQFSYAKSENSHVRITGINFNCVHLECLRPIIELYGLSWFITGCVCDDSIEVFLQSKP